MANSSQTRLAEIRETVFGTTPSAPAFNVLRFVPPLSTSPTINTVQSAEMRSDRNVSDSIVVGETASFTLPFELSYGSYDGLLESLMYNAWSTNVLKNGVTEKSHTLEVTYETGTTDAYHRFKGAIANTLSLSMDSQSLVTGSFGFIAKEFEQAEAAIASSTYTAVNSNPIVNTSTGFASLAVTGLTSPAVTSLTLDISNNITPALVLGSKFAREHIAGQFSVTGTMSLYFENDEAMTIALADTVADLTFKVGGASELNYVFVLGSIKLGNPTVTAGGADQPLILEVPFTGIYDSSDAATLKITRTPAA